MVQTNSTPTSRHTRTKTRCTLEPVSTLSKVVTYTSTVRQIVSHTIQLTKISSVIQFQTHVFQFSCNNGIPAFTKVADTPESNAYVLGVGHGTVTSLNDQPGSGLLWISDVEGSNLRIYNAVPNGPNLTLINSFVTPGVTKFTRPVFGDGIAYQGTTQGYIYAYGSPVNLPMNCSSPYDFGTVDLNATSAPVSIQCQATIALTVTGITLSGNANFVISTLTSLPATIAAGTNFSFQATFAPKSVGPLSSSIVLNTTQDTSGYSTNTPVQLRGIARSRTPLLQTNPNTVSFSGYITGQEAGGANQSIIFTNAGNGNLSITSISFSTTSETGPWISANVSRSGTSVGPFTFIGIPSNIPSNSGSTIIVNFNPTISGSYAAFVRVASNGGSRIFDVVASGSDYPVALLEFQTPDGSGWVKYDNTTAFTFGNVTENTTRYLKMRLTNNGSSNAAALSVTVSKPPFGNSGLIAASNNVDLAEGTILSPGQSATATLFCAAPKSQVNVPAYNGTTRWTMNTGDPSFGKQYIQFFCNAVAEQYGPTLGKTGTAKYEYVGCFRENNPGRQLATLIYNNATSNSNEMCISACSAAGYIFAGTQYTQECWCGYTRPKEIDSETDCNYPCTGNVNEICGGNGVNGGLAFISLFADSTRFDGNATEDPGPYTNPGTLGFTSLGCYSEGTNGRALANLQSIPAANLTVANCLSVCSGYALAGMEYSGEVRVLGSVR